MLLVFTQSGCGPCGEIVPELNRVQSQGRLHVLVVNNGPVEETRMWASEVEARFPVLAQDSFTLSKRYEAFATPFAFLIDEGGRIASKGIVGSRQHLGYVVGGAGRRLQHHDAETGSDARDSSRSGRSLSSEEVSHA